MALRKGSNLDFEEPFNIFWNEYHDIEQTSSLPRNLDEDEVPKKEDNDKNEAEIQWLSDVGFRSIAEKLRDHKQIDQNDEDMRLITSSLTKSQANAVRRRIQYLNDAIQKNQPEVISAATVGTLPQPRKHKDVRDIFDTSKNEEPSAHHTRSRRMTDETPNRHHRGDQRQHVSKTTSDALYKDVPLTVHQKVQVSSKISVPAVAPKPTHVQSGGKTTAEKKKSEHRDDKPTRTQHRKQHSGTRSEHSKGQPYHANEVSTKHPPGSGLTFMTGVQRERAINEKQKSNKPHRSTPVSKNSKNNVNRLKPSDERSYRRHSVPTQQIDNTSSRKYPSDDEYVPRGRPSKLDRVEVDGVCHSSEVTDLDNVELPCDYIDVDDDTFDIDKSKNNLVTGGGGGQDKNVPLVVTSMQNIYLPYTKNNSVTSCTITSRQTNVSSSSSPSISRPPYTIPATRATSIPCAFEKSPPHNITSQKDRIIKSASCSPTPVSHSPTPVSYSPSSPGLDIRGCNIDNKPKKNNTSVSSLDQDADIIPFDSVSSSTSPKETSQNKMNTNHLRTSDISRADINHNDFLRSCSDDSKSISSRESFGSLDDLGNQGVDIDVDPTQVSIIMGKDSPEPPADQPPAPDGDARLDVGGLTPKEQRDIQESFPNVPKFKQTLPNFNLAKDITGLTEVDDLSDGDMEKVRSIALIELTALFDAYQIPMNRKKPLLRPKFKDSGVFGVALTDLSRREKTKNQGKGTVPRVFKEILLFIERYGLKEEGVLRVPGAQTRVKALQEALDKNDLNSIKWEERNVKDVSACLKKFLRDLPEPLLSYEYLNTFLSVEDLPDRKIQLQALNLLVILLKPIHQKTLKALLGTLKKIIDNEDSNKMGLTNVAMIMAPNLLLSGGNKIEVEGHQKAAAMTDIMRMLIKYQNILWTIPSFMVGQIRCIYESGLKTKDPKAVKKIIQKRGHMNLHRGKPSTRSSGSSGDELDHVDTIIKVKAPSLNKQSMAIKLTTDTTATDVIAKFQWRRQNSHKEKDEIESSRLNIAERSIKGGGKGVKYHLYEVGGNIGERRIESGANITAVKEVNPHAEWVLKASEK